MKSVMVHQFSQAPAPEIQRSTFNRSSGHKTTFDSGYLIPIFVDEALPGDTFNLHATVFARLATPIVPIMDNMYLDTFYFSVPNRLLWDHWENFMGDQATPMTPTEYLIPQVESPVTTGFVEGTIADYFGLKLDTANLSVSALPFRAYNLIYNEWFRAKDFIEPVDVPRGDGPDDMDTYGLYRRGKRHDYFTSALPWPQRGPAVQLPLGLSAPVVGDGNALHFNDGGQWLNLGHSPAANGNATWFAGTSSLIPIGSTINGANPTAVSKAIGLDDTYGSGMIADLSDAIGTTVNSFREAVQLQKMFERDARGGSRYAEIIRSHFHINSPDQRLQRPEILGMSSQLISINPVQQTSSTPSDTGVEGTTPQGNLAAYGLVTDSKGGFNHSFVEHCTIIGLACVRCDLTYQSGHNRMWNRKTRYDYYWPTLAHLGEQEILNKEIFAVGDSTDDDVWGYQERYAEYRYKPSIITGKMRSSNPASLDVWHLSQDFGQARPQLNQSFIEEDPPIARCVAVDTEPQFIFDSYFDLKCARPMPVYSIPGLVDHF